jgi:hypothetical protein
MTIDIKRASSLRISLHPVLAQMCTPLPGCILLAELIQFLAQATNFRHTIQAQQFSELTGGMSSKFLNCFDATKGHGRQEQKNMQCTIISADLAKHGFRAMKKAVCQKCRQGTERTSFRHIEARLKTNDPPLPMPKAASMRSSVLVHAVPNPPAASASTILRDDLVVIV